MAVLDREYLFQFGRDCCSTTQGHYYENLDLLPVQIGAVFVPTLVPFAVLTTATRHRFKLLPLFAVSIIGGWSYVVYIDTRPYQDGGASITVFFGWMTCGILSVAASLPVLFKKSETAPQAYLAWTKLPE